MGLIKNRLIVSEIVRKTSQCLFFFHSIVSLFEVASEHGIINLTVSPICDQCNNANMVNSQTSLEKLAFC